MTPPGATHFHYPLTVEALEDGRVAVTVILPPDLVQDYARFLDALSTFFEAASRKGSIAVSEARAAASSTERETALASYRDRLVASYDRYLSEGLSRKEAIKRIAEDLRAVNHPWRSPDLVRSQLVLCGRGGRVGRPPGGRK